MPPRDRAPAVRFPDLVPDPHMEGSAQHPWPQEPEWILDRRSAPRWRDVRTVLVRVGGNEHLGKTLNISTGGAAVAVPGKMLPRGTRLLLCVVFEEGVRGLAARLVNCRRRGHMVRLGVAWEDLEESHRRFLARRYGSPAGGLGSVR